MTTQEKIACVAICITVIGWPTTAYLAYRFGLRSQRLARKLAEGDAVKGRIRSFYAIVCELKALVSHKNQMIG